MNEEPKLDAMSFGDLERLRDMLVKLCRCGDAMGAWTGAIFDLTPGCEILIRTKWTMPGLNADPIFDGPDPDKLVRLAGVCDGENQQALNANDSQAEGLGSVLREGLPDFFQPHIDKHVDGQPIDHWPGPVDQVDAEQPPSPAAAEQAAKELERDVSEASPEPAGEGTGAARECAAPVTQDPAPRAQGAWTAEEDTLLIETCAWQMFNADLSLNAAAKIAAGILQRPVQGTQFRAKAGLKGRIMARLAERKAGNNVENMVAIPSGPPVTASVRTAAVNEGPKDAKGAPALPQVASEPAVAGAGSSLTPHGLSELDAHVRDVKRDKTWTLQRDDDLLHFAIAGWPDHEIALELGVPLGEIKPRFNVLTKARTFKRDYVLGAIERMLSAQAAA
jgi:hypothetical protein